jgi:hypothetical protein
MKCHGKSWKSSWLQLKHILVGGWYAYPSEKIRVRQLGLLFPTHGKIIQMFQTTSNMWIFPSTLAD